MLEHLKILVVLLALPLVGCDSKTPEQRARERFLEFARTGFKADISEIERAFRCFREGALADDYAEILKTAHKKYNSDAKASNGAHSCYEWIVDDGTDFTIFRVFVGKSPAVVCKAEFERAWS